ncbi:hypothetical protein Q8W25_01855 [Shimia thalassica]|uniref:hypothetical protein n=1 Tax=Shimia thalassica TaxID=1715693 RepID=UPI002735B0BD|nr:hypothetical protein [Shimia thalassica]MDP2492736.1 hypothetical protein [Shimia thalassica]
MPQSTIATNPYQAAVTVLTSTSGMLCKQFHLMPHGLTKSPAATMGSGTARHTPVHDARDLADLLDSLSQSQAVTLGRMRDDRAHAEITTVTRPKAGAIARAKQYFHHAPSVPTWLLIDYDTDAMPSEVSDRITSMGGPWAAMREIWPELTDAAYVLRPSSSDGIQAEGWPSLASNGLHAYVRVKDGQTIPEALETLHRKAWLNGLGWIKLSASGNRLVRSIVDVAVAGPERIVFEAPPLLGQGVTRRVHPTFSHEGVTLDAPVMADQENAKAGLLIEQAKHAMTEASEAAKSAYVDRRVTDLSNRTGLTQAQARTVITRMVQGATLDDRHLLQVGNGAWVSVGEILDNPDKWDRVGIPDPVEGIMYGANSATLLLKPRPDHPGDRPLLVSHAHGEKVIYRFHRYENPAPAAIGPFYAAPVAPRADAIAAHGQVIRDWAERAAACVRASREVKDLYDREDREYERAIGVGEIMGRYGLDYAPLAYLTKHTPVPKVMLTGALGIGKTKVMLDVVYQYSDLKVLVLVPDHSMVDEIAARYAGLGATDGLALKGRGSIDPQGDGKALMCKINARAERVVAHGLSVKAALCEQCQFRNSCGYQRQMRSLGNARVVFAPHDLAWTPLPDGFKPDLVVFDERPRDYGIEDVSLPVAALLYPPSYDGPSQGVEFMNAANAHSQRIAPLMTALNWAATYYPYAILTALRSFGWTRDGILEAVEGLGYFEATGVLRTCRDWVGYDLAKVDAALMAAPKRTRELKMLFSALADEIETDQVQPVTVQVREGKIHVTRLRTLANGRNAPLLHLDGTGDHEMMQLLFGPMEHEHHPVERNANITQITGHSFSKAYLTAGQGGWSGEWLERSEAFQDNIRNLVNGEFSDAAVFTNKASLASLGLSGDRFGHFGALRGLNRWEGYQRGMIIGQLQAPEYAVEHIAGAYAVAAGHHMIRSEYVDQWRGIRMADGSGVPLLVKVHPDAWALRVLEQLREAELLQGLDRLRLIYNAQRKDVYLLSSVVLDATVHAVKDWKEFVEGGSRIERAVKRLGFVPMSGREASRLCNDLWGSYKTAQRDLDVPTVLQGLKLGTNGNKNLYNTECPKFGVWRVRYRRNETYAYSVEAYVVGDHTTARDTIERATGSLREFELIEFI